MLGSSLLSSVPRSQSKNLCYLVWWLTLSPQREERIEHNWNTTLLSPSTLFPEDKLLSDCKQCKTQWCGLTQKSRSVTCQLQMGSTVVFPVYLIQNNQRLFVFFSCVYESVTGNWVSKFWYWLPDKNCGCLSCFPEQVLETINLRWS